MRPLHRQLKQLRKLLPQTEDKQKFLVISDEDNHIWSISNIFNAEQHMTNDNNLLPDEFLTKYAAEFGINVEDMLQCHKDDRIEIK